MSKNPLAIFAGSFDPITNGHIDIINRLTSIFNNIDIAVGNSPNKIDKYLFTQDERVKLIERSIPINLDINVYKVNKPLHLFIEGGEFNNYKVTIIKGLRNSEDVEYERKSLDVLESSKIGIETLFMLAGEKYRMISSSYIKQIWNWGKQDSNKKEILEMIPEVVFQAMDEKYKNKNAILSQ